jgi:hypothetical protein
MATVQKFQDFSEQLIRGVHDWDAHTFKVALTNAAPLATNTILTDITQISAGNGYTAGGATTTITLSETGGTTTVQGTSVTFTASGGAMGTFRYYVLYNDTATSPADALIQFWDHGSAVTLNSGDSFEIRFNNTTPGTILTLA